MIEERPAWLNYAFEQIGIDEVKNADVVKQWIKGIGDQWFTENFNPSTVPWCGGFVAHCMRAQGIQIPKLWMRAKEWANWGIRITSPVVGCVVVFERKGGGHVGFVVGKTEAGELIVLGGNQGNCVCLAKFGMDRVVGYFWPSVIPLSQGLQLATMTLEGGLSLNEA